jgi:protein tyrosine/serine phosphatase
MIFTASTISRGERKLGILLLTLAFFGCSAVPRGASATVGIPNFGQVNRGLFRGAQPDGPGMALLQRLGIQTIINLRLPADTWSEEEALAHTLGLGYVSVPLRGLSAPTDADVMRILALIESSPPPVFIHCEHGSDRTGTIIACYRVQHDDWTGERALAEAKSYGFSIFQFGMRRYIRTFSAAHEPVGKPAVMRGASPVEKHAGLQSLPVA